MYSTAVPLAAVVLSGVSILLLAFIMVLATVDSAPYDEQLGELSERVSDELGKHGGEL